MRDYKAAGTRERRSAAPMALLKQLWLKALVAVAVLVALGVVAWLWVRPAPPASEANSREADKRNAIPLELPPADTEPAALEATATSPTS